MLTILGVHIDPVTRTEALERIARFLDEPRPHLVVTPNPEMLVAARRDAEFQRILNSADLAIPDGNGLLLAARMLGEGLPERVTGTDLLADIAAHTAQNNRTIFLLGGHESVAREAAAALQQNNPGIRIVGAESGGVIEVGGWGGGEVSSEILKKIEAVKPEILFVAFGHGKQEKWIAANIDKFPSVRVAMGVGGAFDFLAGRVRRAPAGWRKLGLEWLWRLLQEPRRWRRIFTAVIVFPLLVFFRGKR